MSNMNKAKVLKVLDLQSLINREIEVYGQTSIELADQLDELIGELTDEEMDCVLEFKKTRHMTRAQALAQELFDKAVVPIMDLPLTDDAIKAKGLEIALLMLDQVYDRNTDQSKHDLYCETHGVLMAGDVEY